MAFIPSFNPNAYEPERDRQVVPDGDYECMIVDSDYKPNSKGTGDVLSLTIQILSGQFAGARIWDNLNIVNQNEKAEAKARRRLSKICEVIGFHGDVTDSTQLHNKRFVSKIKYVPPQPKPGTHGEYPEKNEVASYKAINQSAPNVSQQRQQPMQSQPVTTQPAANDPTAGQAQPSAKPAWAQ